MVQFGRYRDLEEVGRGGFATVYKAHDPKLKRAVALKVLHPEYSNDSSLVERFHHEAQTVAGFNHPNIVTIYDFGEVDKQLFIAMEFLSGGDLQLMLDREQAPFTIDRAIPLLRPIATAIDYAHMQGVLHRDIKPSNLMLQETGNDLRIVLTDFGLVKVMEGSVALTITNQIVGTPEYMAPEQVRMEKVGPHADLYAFGILTYRMLVGKVPFPGHSISVLNAHVNFPVPKPQDINEDVSAEVAEILIKMLAKVPEERFETATQFIEALQASEQIATQNRQREAQVVPLYTQLLQARESKNWLEVITLATKIEVIYPNFKDVDKIRVEAREVVEETPPTLKIDAQIGENDAQSPTISNGRETRVFKQVIIGALIIGLIIFGGYSLYTLFSNIGTEEPAEPIQIVDTTPTFTSTPTLTVEPTMAFSATPTEKPTVAPTSTEEATATIEPTLENVNTPPQSALLGDSWQRPMDDMTMMYVPGGTFLMGIEDGGEDEQPVHEVTLDEFWIDQTEVTNEQFANFVDETDYVTVAEVEGSGWVWVDTGEGWDDTEGADWRHPYGPGSDLTGLDQHPVVLVTWDDAKSYCDWVGGRLLTEAEWEYAARGGNNFIYPWGNQFESENLNFCDVNCPFEWRDESVDDGYEYTAPIRSYPQGDSWVGASDMATNVLEWVNDTYDSEYYANSPVYNPEGSTINKFKVLRGGSWFSNAFNSRSTDRYDLDPSARGGNIGFRCAYSSN